MKLLSCLVCEGEVDIIGQEGYCLRIKCQKCGYTSAPSNRPKKKEIKLPEITIIKKVK